MNMRSICVVYLSSEHASNRNFLGLFGSAQMVGFVYCVVFRGWVLKRRGCLWGFVFIFYYCFCRESPGKLRLLNKLYIIIMSKFMSVHVLNNKITKVKLKHLRKLSYSTKFKKEIRFIKLQ